MRDSHTENPTDPPENRPSLRKRISPVGWIVVGAVVFALLLSGWQNYQQVVLIDRTLEKVPEGADTWDLAQMQKEFLKFKNRIDLIAATGKLRDSRRISLQWDLVWSRLEIITHGSTGEVLQDLAPSINKVPEIKRLIEEIDGLLPSLLKGSANVIVPIQTRTDAALVYLQATFSGVHNYELARQYQTRKRLKNLQLRHVGITLVFVALFLALLTIIYRNFRSELGQVYNLLTTLRQSEERNRNLVEGSLQGLLVHRDYKPLFANQAFADVFGFENPEAIQQLEDMATLIAPKDRDRLLDYHRERLDGGAAPDHFSFQGIKKDGSTVMLEVMIRLIDWEGESAVQAVIIDITERERMDAMKRDFIATVSHELRTPLTAIVGSLGLIQQGALGKVPASFKEMLQVAHRNCERLVRLVTDILDLQKVESGKLELRMVPVDVGSLLDLAIEVNQGYADRFGVTFKLGRVDGGAAVTGDRDRIMQVLTNLMANAAKHAPRGSAVELSVSRIGGSVRVGIADKGPGIPENFKARIFEKFAQPDVSDSRQNEGSGLGLSISKALVEGHGGTIGFTSTPGEGTTFYFDLPELAVSSGWESAGSGGGRRPQTPTT